MDDPAELLEGSKEGSPQAFSRIVRHYQSRVRAYLGRYVRDANVVEDLAQDTFIRAYRGLSQYRGDSNLGVWLLGIARNLALMHLREEARRRDRETGLLRPALAGWLAESLGREEDDGEHERALSALEECLHGLPDASSALVDGYYFKGRSASEMARETGKKESAVWMTLLRIRDALRRCIRVRTGAAEANP
jgi:RNA polymerase sigma-70 factor (ECF subfamily)